jgi:hypothetical protein
MAARRHYFTSQPNNVFGFCQSANYFADAVSPGGKVVRRRNYQG